MKKEHAKARIVELLAKHPSWKRQAIINIGVSDEEEGWDVDLALSMKCPCCDKTLGEHTNTMYCLYVVTANREIK